MVFECLATAGQQEELDEGRQEMVRRLPSWEEISPSTAAIRQLWEEREILNEAAV